MIRRFFEIACSCERRRLIQFVFGPDRVCIRLLLGRRFPCDQVLVFEREELLESGVVFYGPIKMR